jgi:hypothetical protein
MNEYRNGFARSWKDKLGTGENGIVRHAEIISALVDYLPKGSIIH